MTDSLQTTAQLMRALAQAKPLDQAAKEAGLPLEQARRALIELADRYDPPTQEPVSAGATEAVAFIDGGARGNPGPAGCGAVLFDRDKQLLAEGSLYVGQTTNNVAEYEGLLLALRKALELGVQSLEVRSDSQLLVRQMTGAYRVKALNLQPLYNQAQTLARRFKSIHYTHVPREQNKHADRLANKAMDQKANG